MFKMEFKSAARLAATAGLGLSLAFAAAPTVAMAESVSAAANQSENDSQSENSRAKTVSVSTFEELTKAVTTGGSISLANDITARGNIIIPANVSVELNLNGKKLVLGETYAIYDSGSLTILDSSASAGPDIDEEYSVTYESGSITAKDNVVNVQDGGFLEVKSGALSSTNSNPSVIRCLGNTKPDSSWNTPVNSRVVISGGLVEGYLYGVTAMGNGASVQVNGGVITAAAACVSGNGRVDDEVNYGGTSITITGGTLIANDPGAPGDMKGCVYNPQYGSVSISGGTLHAVNGLGVLMRAGDLTVSGGSIEATGTVTGRFADGSSSVTSAAIYLDYVVNYPGAKVDTNDFAMTDGEISSDDSVVPLVKKSSASEDVKTTEALTGGTVKGNNSNDALVAFIPNGYKLQQGTDGTWSPVVPNPVASVDGRVYPSLAAACAAATPGQTVVLLYDTTINDCIDLAAGTTLDLKGNTVTIDGWNPSSSTGILAKSGEVTIKNGTILDQRSKLSEGGTDNTTANWNAVVADGPGTVLTMDGVTITSCAPKTKSAYNYIVRAKNGADLVLNEGTVLKEDSQGLVCGDDGETYGVVGIAIVGVSEDGNVKPSELAKLTINGADIEVSGFAISGNGMAHGTEIVINDGNVISKQSQGIYHPQAGALTVNGGFISGQTGIEMRSGELTVNGGTIKGTGTPVNIDPNGNGSTSTGAGIAVAQHTTKLPIKVTVKDGTITGYSALYEKAPEDNPETDKIELSITGGSFKATGDEADAVYSKTYSANKKGFVSGGSFNTNPIKFVVDNSVVKINSEDSFTALERKNLPAGTYVVPDGAEPLTAKDFQPGMNVVKDENGNYVATRPQTPSQGEHAVKVEQAEGGKVVVTPTSADKGDEVTITATPDKGQEVRSVAVTTKDGKTVKVAKGDKANTWTFEMPDGEVTVKVVFGCDGGELCPTHKFDDVLTGAWYHDVVDWAVEEGLLSGYEDGKLGPDGTLSRAQLATVLWRQAGEPEAEGGLSFADCDPEAFYAEAVAWADGAGIIAGYGDGTNFGPEDPVTREQLATILWRQAGEPEGKGDLAKYPDGDEATDYAVPALEWAVEEGVLSGFGDGSLAPGGVLSRAMLAAMLQRMGE